MRRSRGGVPQWDGSVSGETIVDGQTMRVSGRAALVARGVSSARLEGRRCCKISEKAVPTGMADNREILHGLMDAQLNESYYRHRASKASWYDKVARGLITLASTTAFAAAFTDALGKDAWKWIALATAMLSVFSQSAKLTEKSLRWSDLAARWTDVARMFRMLDLAASSANAHEVAAAFERSEQLQREDLDPRHDRLVRKLQDQVVEQFKDRLAIENT